MNETVMIARLKEPSTWRGIIVLLGLLGVTISPEHMEAIMATVAALYGIIQICRSESGKKIVSDQNGMSNVVLLICVAILTIGTMTLSIGCNTTATQQIAAETDDPLTISKAAYLDSLTWYNNAQESLIRYYSEIPQDKAKLYNEKLNEMDAALKMWKAAISLNTIYDDTDAFIEAKNKLIDLGFQQFVEEE